MNDFDRTTGVGASEVSGILGQSPFRTPVGVWMEKVGLGGYGAETDAMRNGTALEGGILAVAAETRGQRMTRNRVTFKHASWPDVPLFATPDGFTRRRDAVVEVKLVGHRWGDWRDGPPTYVQTQVQSQMAVFPRASHAVVVALIGSDVRTFEIEADRVMAEAITSDVRSWWEAYVRTEIAPPAETDDDRWAVARILAGRSPATRPSRTPSEVEAEVGGQLVAHLATLDEVEAAVALERLLLAEAAVEADVVGDGWRGAWTERRNIDWAAIARDAGVAQEAIEARTTTSRVFSFRRVRRQDRDGGETE